MFKRITSMLLCVAMLLTMVPVQAFAAETGLEEASGLTEYVAEAVEAGIMETEAPATTEQKETVPQETTEPAPVTTAPEETEATEQVTEPAYDAAELGEGYCGEALTWELGEDGVLLIRGTGPMADYTGASKTPWYSQRANILEIQVEAGVTSLGSYAFASCTKVTKVTLPEGLLVVGRAAFYGCSALETLVLPDSVESLGYQAFYNCSKLSSLHLPASWNACPSYNGSSSGYNYQGNLFVGCKALTEVVLPDGMTTIPSYAFYNAKYIKTIQLPETLVDLGASAFAGCNALENITLPASVTDLPEYAFSNCSVLAQLTLPDDLKSIGRSAFNNCYALETLVLPEGVESLGHQAFYNCTSLSSITLPASWTQCPSHKSGSTGSSYQGRLFYNCKALTEIVLPEGMTEIPDYALYEANYLQSVVVPEGITELKDYAFYGCKALTEINLPEGLLSLGRDAFSGCTSLETLVLPDTVESLGYQAFYNCTKLSSIHLPASWNACPSYNGINTGSSYQGRLFYNCKALREIVLPEGMTEIPEYALYEANYLQSIQLPEGISELKTHAFYGCKNLISVTLPQTLVSVGREAFSGCAALETLVLPDSVESLGYQAFYNCTKLSNLHLPASWTACPSYNGINTGISYQGRLFVGCKALTEIVLPEGMTQIPDYAFYNASYLQSITVPESITELKEYAFAGCSALTQISLPQTLVSVGRQAFSSCTSLETLVLPDSVESLGHQAFYDCTKLSDLHLPASWTACPSYRDGSSGINYQGQLFVGCKALTTVTLPEGMTEIPDYAFYNANYLQSITVPEGITELKEYAFYGCRALTQITLPQTLASVGREAFSGCSSLETLVLPDSVESLGYQAFYNCTKLSTLHLPTSWNACPSYRDGSSGSNYQGRLFYNCNALTTVTLPEGMKAIPDYAFHNANYLQSITLPESITELKERSFSNCTSLTQVQLPQSLKVIPRDAFSGCNKLVQINLPEGVEQIDQYAFSSCSSLEQITLPAGLKELGQYAFSYCGSLKQIDLPAGLEQINQNTFYNCGSLEQITLPAGLKQIGQYAFYDCSSLTQLVLPTGLEQIGLYAFSECEGLKTVAIPDSVTSIGTGAFYNCKGLEAVSLPAGLTQIASSCFYNCASLKAVSIPESVATIGSSAFFGCGNLEQIHMGKDTKIESSAFGSLVSSGTLGSISWSMDMAGRTLTVSGTGDMILERDDQGNAILPWKHLKSLTRYLVLGDGVMSIDAGAFQGFHNITSVDISNSVHGVGAYSFADCTSLERVVLGESMKIVGEGTFSRCDSLNQVVILSEEHVSLGSNAIPDSSEVTVIYPESNKEMEETLKEEFSNVNQETWDNTLPGRDVVLVLDVSGSMAGSRIQDLKTAVKLFLDRVGGITTNTRVALVSYESSARVLADFTWDMEDLKKIVDGLDANGGTEYLRALNSAESVLAGSDQNIRAMIFFTDGDPNDARDPILSKCESLWSRYQIYTVGFLPSYTGEQLLIQMAGGPENYYRSDDMDSLADAFRSLSTEVGEEVEEEDYYDVTPQRHFAIRTSDGSYPAVIGFTVAVGTKTYTSGLPEDAKVFEENIEVEIPEDFTGSVVIYRKGYVTYEMPASLVGNYNTVIMYPESKEPFVQQLLYVPVKDRPSTRSCFSTVSIEEASLMDPVDETQRFYVDINWNDCEPGEVWLQQGSAKLYLTDDTYTDVAFSRTFHAGDGSVYLHYTTADGQSFQRKTAIKILPADNRLPIDLGESMKIPEKDVSQMKIFGDRSLEIDFSEWTDVPVSFTVGSDGSISGTIGLKKDGENLGISGKGDGKTLKEALSNFKKMEGMDDDQLSDMLDEITDMAEPKSGKFGLKGKVWLVGYFSGKMDAMGELHLTEINAYLIAEGGVSYTVPFTVLGIPLYFQTQLAAAIKSGIVLHQKEGTLLPLPNVKVDANMTISLGGGVGVEGVLSGGAQGDGTAGLEIMLMDADANKAYVKAAFSLVGSVLGISGKWELYQTPKYYFYKNGRFTWEKEMQAMVSSAAFTLIPEPSHNSQFYSTGKALSTDTMDYTLLKTDTTQFSEPQLVAFDDGTKLVVWLDAVAARVGADVHAVYYSYFDGKQWSAPSMVDDDGTNDYGLSLTEVNGEAYVLWHDYDIVFGAELEDVNVAAEHINISVAKFDKAGQSMRARREFSAGGYDHQPQIKAHGGEVQLAWKCGIEEAETMYLASSQDGTGWSEAWQEDVSWYIEGGQQIPSDYAGEYIGNTGEVQNLDNGEIRAIVFRSQTASGGQNVFAAYNAGQGWGDPIQLTHISGGTYVDAFGADLTEDTLELVMNVTHENGKSDLAYHSVSLGTDLAIVRADYDHFSLVPGKNAVFFARVTNRGPRTEDMLKLRLVDSQGNILKTQLTEAVIASGDTARLEMNYIVPADNSLREASLVVLPVHSKDVDEENNSKSFSISYNDISVEEMQAYVSEEATMVTVRIVNRGNVVLPQGSYTLHYQKPDGTQVAQGKLPQLNAGEVETLTLTLEPLAANEMLYLQVAEYENENLISNNTGMANILSVYQTQETVKSVTIDREFLAMEPGQTVQLRAQCDPDAAQERLSWRVEAIEGENVIALSDTGLVEALNPGSAYAVAYVENEDHEVEARCRVDVAEPLLVTGIRLGAQQLTTELFSTAYTQLDILLMLPQNLPTAQAAGNAAGWNKGVALESARFTDEALNHLFALQILDDRRVQVVPTEYAVENPSSVKNSYTGSVTVTIQGQEFTSEALKLTVKKTMPKLKASVAAFNAFYTKQSQPIQITGATVTSVTADPVLGHNALPVWLTFQGENLVLTEDAPQKNTTGKVYLKVETEQWRIPVSLTLSVKCAYQAPGLKLSATSVQFSGRCDSSSGVWLQLLPKNNKQTLEQLNVDTVTIAEPEGCMVADFDPTTGAFLLKAEENFTAGKLQLLVSFTDTDELLKLPLTVKAAQVKLKLSQKTVTLNAAGDGTLVAVTATPSDFILAEPTIRLTDKTGADKLDSGELSVLFENGTIQIRTTEKTPEKAEYTLFIRFGGSKEESLKIKTIGTAPTMTVKQTANLDLSFRNKPGEAAVTFKNFTGADLAAYSGIVTETGSEQALTCFRVEQASGGKFHIYCTDPAQVNVKGKYTLTVTATLPDGSQCTGSVALKLKQTAVKLKLTPTKLTLNKDIGDQAVVDVFCATKDYEFIVPDWQLMDKSGKQDMTGKLDIHWVEGRLVIGVNDATEYGATYKLLVAPAEGEAATANMTISVLAQNKSQASATLKLKGSLDPVRSATTVTVTSTYKNCAPDTLRTEELKVLISNGADVTELFQIERNPDGSFTIQRAAGAQIDQSLKYQVQLLTTFETGAVAQSKAVNLPVKMAAAKLTAEAAGVLFAQDKHSRVDVVFASKDATQNRVARVEIKDAKYQNLLVVHDYGSGQFAIGFREGAALGTKPISVSLNVFLEGNTSAKANATVKLKITIVP